MPEIEVRYEHLTIEADAYVGSRALPTFINFMTNFAEVKKSKRYLDFKSRFSLTKMVYVTNFLFFFGLIGYIELSPYPTKSKEKTNYS